MFEKVNVQPLVKASFFLITTITIIAIEKMVIITNGAMIVGLFTSSNGGTI